MTILVTGGAGFIGSSLIQRLLGANHRVVCFDNFDSYYSPYIKQLNIAPFRQNKNFFVIEGDIRNWEKLESAFQLLPVDVIVHAAARAGVRPSLLNPLLYEDVNVKGTLNILEAARRFKVKNTVFLSSSSVYGNSRKTPFSETDNVDNPISPYAATKKSAELLCYTYHHLYSISIICLRLFTVYGPRQRPEMAIHQFARRIDLGKPISMYGDGNTKRDYTYIDDLVDGIERAIERPLGYEIINLGESQTTSLAELIKMIEDEVGKKAIIHSEPSQPGDVDNTFADIEKAKRLLGYNPCVPVREGIKRFISWYNSEGLSWHPYISENN